MTTTYTATVMSYNAIINFLHDSLTSLTMDELTSMMNDVRELSEAARKEIIRRYMKNNLPL